MTREETHQINIFSKKCLSDQIFEKYAKKHLTNKDDKNNELEDLSIDIKALIKQKPPELLNLEGYLKNNVEISCLLITGGLNFLESEQFLTNYLPHILPHVNVKKAQSPGIKLKYV